MMCTLLDRSLLACLISVAVTACSAPSSKTASPFSPSPVPPLPPLLQIIGGPYVVSGRVVDEMGALVPGSSVSAFIDQGASGYASGYPWEVAHGAIPVDAAGGFQLEGLPAGVTVVVRGTKPGYVQQCASELVRITGDTRVDVELVSKANVSSSRSTGASRLISGVVVEIVDGIRRPAVGAVVDYEGISGLEAAWTITDSQGRYLLCGVSGEATVGIGVAYGGREAYVSLAPNAEAAPDVVF